MRAVLPLTLGLVLVVGCNGSDGGGDGGDGFFGGAAGTTAGGTSPMGFAGKSATGGASSLGGANAGGASAAGASAGGAAGNHSAMCDAYIQCATLAMPAGLAPVLAAYGANGSCWAQGDPALCDTGCRAGIVAAHKSDPSVEACDLCGADSDCPDEAPSCDTATGKCVQCTTNTQCNNDTFARMCNPTTHICVQCASDDDCTKGPSAGPFCDPGSGKCVECANNAECDSPFSDGDVCDPDAKQCRPCMSGTECTSGMCNQGICIGCTTDAMCSAPTPHCGGNGQCVQCTSNAECAPGVCSSLGTCCGQTTCADQKLSCGTTIDLTCLLAPVDCGTCSGGDYCDAGACVAKPAKTCTNEGCATGVCAFFPDMDKYACTANNHSNCSNTTTPKQPCDPGWYCDDYEEQTTGEHVSLCTPYCLDDSDCAHGATCTNTDGGYGWCSIM